MKYITIYRTIEHEADEKFPFLYGEFRIECKVHYTPGDPGRIGGPPEKCWPPEPEEVEYEIVSVELLDQEDNPTVKAAMESQAEKMLENGELEEALLELIHEEDSE